jgi:hypothetical protein
MLTLLRRQAITAVATPVANVVRFTLHAHFCLTFVLAPFSVVLGSTPQYLSMISKASVHRICGSTDRRACTVYPPKAVESSGPASRAIAIRRGSGGC